jgi:hypothetical protein
MKKLFLPFSFTLMSIAAFSQATTKTRETTIKYLSGTDKDHTVPWDFYCTGGRNSGKWTKIAVPSNWELQGFGNYNYGHDKVKSNEQGLYKYKFNTQPAWQGKKVFLVFEGSMTDTKVTINGKQAGAVHQGSFYRFKYDITDLLNAKDAKGNNTNKSARRNDTNNASSANGENLLEVTVSKTSANTSVNNAERGNSDFWLFGGIYRPVYLEIVPQTFIDRIAIDARADGSFQMDVYPQNMKDGDIAEAQVKKLNGENVGKPFSVKAGAAAEKITLTNQFSNPLLWNSEFPNLYQVVLSIKTGKEIIHQVRQRFGFRTVELRKGDGFYVNGVKILFKGSDRHSFWPETGRTLSHGVDLLDVTLMKEMNMNAVRMSHYPPDPDFLNVCDSLGLYVLDELTGWQAAYDTIVGHKLVKEMVVRDVNHPAIVIWDNGNEGGWNRGLDGDYSLYDPQQRIVIHPTERFNGTNTRHYPNYQYVVNSVAEEKDVFFPTEFMHGLYDGGAGAGLDDYWNLMCQHPHGAGGFIWAFLDEAVVRTDKDGVYDTDGNHAPDGVVGPHREKEASFYTIKEIWSPVHIDTLIPDEHAKEEDLKEQALKDKGENFKNKPLILKVENRYFFTNLSQCTFNWHLASFPSPAGKSIQPIVTAAGKADPIDVVPGRSGTLALHIPANWAKSDALYVSAYGPDKKELFTWSWVIKTPGAINRKDSKNMQLVQTPGAEEDSSTLTVRCDGLRYRFDKMTGCLEKVIKSNTEVSLSGGPILAGVATKLTRFSYSAGKSDYKVQADYEGAGSLHIQWTFTEGNPARLEYNYTQPGASDFSGITFNYPEEKITGMKWLGRGPYRVWKNRLKGQQFGVWQKDYNNAVTGEDWKYPEFKGYHAEMNWVVIENRESPFTVYTDVKNLYLQMLHPQRAKDSPDNNNVEPPFPAGNIGFLNGIPPIGDKFHAANQLGPQSQKNEPEGAPVSGTLWFDFGK